MSILSAATLRSWDRRQDARMVSRTVRGAGDSSVRKRSRLAATAFWAGGDSLLGDTGVGAKPIPKTALFAGPPTPPAPPGGSPRVRAEGIPSPHDRRWQPSSRVSLGGGQTGCLRLRRHRTNAGVACLVLLLAGRSGSHLRRYLDECSR